MRDHGPDDSRAWYVGPYSKNDVKMRDYNNAPVNATRPLFNQLDKAKGAGCQSFRSAVDADSSGDPNRAKQSSKYFGKNTGQWLTPWA